MKWISLNLLHVICLFLRLLKPHGAKTIIAENILLRQQLVVLNRKKKKCPPLLAGERIIMALCTLIMTPKRMRRASIAIAGSTLLKFHKYLVNRKYSRLFSNKTGKRPGPKGPTKELIKFIVEMKEKNPRYGCPKIAFLASEVLGQDIGEGLVRRILRKYYKPVPGGGPSWLLPIGKAPNKLWSLDFFRVESVFLQTYWIMIILDQFTRNIIGFAVHEGNLDGGTVCCMFNKIMAGKCPPKHLSSDNDPLFLYWLWLSNLDTYGIDEIKTVPHVPWSHPFIERNILSVRSEFTDWILIWSKSDLEVKLSHYQEYFNKYRVHYAHDGKTPSEMAGNRALASIDLKNYRWKPVCCGLFHTPIAA